MCVCVCVYVYVCVCVSIRDAATHVDRLLCAIPPRPTHGSVVRIAASITACLPGDVRVPAPLPVHLNLRGRGEDRFTTQGHQEAAQPNLWQVGRGVGGGDTDGVVVWCFPLYLSLYKCVISYWRVNHRVLVSTMESVWLRIGTILKLPFDKIRISNIQWFRFRYRIVMIYRIFKIICKP